LRTTSNWLFSQIVAQWNDCSELYAGHDDDSECCNDINKHQRRFDDDDDHNNNDDNYPCCHDDEQEINTAAIRGCSVNDRIVDDSNDCSEATTAANVIINGSICWRSKVANEIAASSRHDSALQGDFVCDSHDCFFCELNVVILLTARSR
jgi:hypothetical protein